MSLYHLIEGLETSDLDDLGNLILDIVSERRAAENAEQDRRYEASAEVRANHAGARTDSLTEELDKQLQALFPALREPLRAIGSAA